MCIPRGLALECALCQSALCKPKPALHAGVLPFLLEMNSQLSCRFGMPKALSSAQTFSNREKHQQEHLCNSFPGMRVLLAGSGNGCTNSAWQPGWGAGCAVHPTVGLSAQRRVRRSALSPAPGRHEMRDEQELPPAPLHLWGETGGSFPAGGEGASSLWHQSTWFGQGLCAWVCGDTEASPRSRGSGLGDLHPGGGTRALAGWQRRLRCRWVAAVPVTSPEACEEQAEVASHWWASAGKENTSLTTCLSSASAAKYPPCALG